MNIVLLTCNYLPHKVPEAPCATRFANALAKKGHKVVVVAWNRGNGVPPAVCAQIETEAVQVIRIPEPCARTMCMRAIDRAAPLRYWTTLGNGKMIEAVRSALKSMKDPVLISRSDPVMSTMVALKCRKYASKWIAHFSDVMPFGHFGRLGGIMRWCVRRMVLRTIIEADAVAVTCENAKRWFIEKYSIGDKEGLVDKFLVCRHIGTPVLAPVPDRIPAMPFGKGKVISHCGYLGRDRYVDEISVALAEVARRRDIVFSMIGGFSKATVDSFQRKGVKTDSVLCDDPGMTTRVNENSDVLLVADTDPVDVEYSPFLPSKFVYALYTDTPIVACSTEDSEMFKLARQFPDAGIYCGNVHSPESLASAVETALDRGRMQGEDRRKLRECFSEKYVIGTYLRDLERLGISES